MEIEKSIKIKLDDDNDCTLCQYHDVYEGNDYNYHEHCTLFDKWNCYNSYDNPEQINKRNTKCIKIFGNFCDITHANISDNCECCTKKETQ